MSATCVRCGKPMADGGPVCARPCAAELAEALTRAAGHAEDAWTVIARQARVGSGGGTRRPEPDPVTEEDLRRNPVNAFGWQASIERPLAGALRPEPGPADLGAFDRLRAVENTVGTWARDLGSDATGLSEACTWLTVHVGWLRAHPAAGEAFKELHDACRQLERLVDRPADKELVGMCDCGKVLYALPGRTVIQCRERTCGATWNVGESRAILREALREKLFTAAEAARFAAHWDDRESEPIRKLINKWAERGRLVPHGWVDDGPLFQFGEVLDRLAETPRRERAREAAEMGA